MCQIRRLCVLLVGAKKLSTVKSSPASPEVAAVSTSARAGVVAEYCEREYFDAECAADDGNRLIVMQLAVFGRMKDGRCVRREYGSIGCRADVLATVDSLCSGRRRCRFHTSTLHSARPCPTELVSYLEASFDCVAGSSLTSQYTRIHFMCVYFYIAPLIRTV